MNSEDTDERMVFVIMLALAAEGEKERRERQRGQHYLTRADLHPEPRYGTAWEAIYGAGNDRAFITTTGFDVRCFHYLLSYFEPSWNSTPIPRNDVDADGESRPERRSLSPTAALALVLHYLSSTMPEYSLQQIFAVTPSVCTRYLSFAMEILLGVFKQIPEAAISWPEYVSEFADYAAMIELRHPLLQKGFCFVDGVNIPVAESEVDDIQNAYYNGWTCSHYCSNVLAFAPDGSLIWCSVNGPGSWHDAAMARALYDKLVNRTPEAYYAIADTAFPRSRADIENRIKTPLKSTSKRPGELQASGRIHEYRQLMNFNTQLVSARQAAEWGMRSFQGSFGRLKLPLPANDHAHRHKILMTCLRLHQIRTRCVGINQIKTVYEKIWRGDNPEGSMVYEQFTQMMFCDIEAKDRVARYYRVDESIINV